MANDQGVLIGYLSHHGGGVVRHSLRITGDLRAVRIEEDQPRLGSKGCRGNRRAKQKRAQIKE
jgi:hypothetical protein